MEQKIENDLGALSTLSINELRTQWARAFKHQPGKRTSRRLLQSSLAYYLQEQHFGGLPGSIKRLLTKLEAQRLAGRALNMAPAVHIKPGTRLVRTWKGVAHQVTVTEQGFEYAGDRYENLSQIARLITGTRWSGPLFFGLKKTATQKPS